MTIDIYADMIFLINFAINTAVLWLACLLTKRRMRLWRLFLGGITASLLYTILIFTPLRPFINVFTSFAILAPSIVIVHGLHGWRRFVIDLAIAYICAFALGGLVLVIMNATSNQAAQVIYATPLNLIIAMILSFGGIKFVRHYIAKKAVNKQKLQNIEIHMGDKKIEITALVDTGMALVEPIGQNPVIIAEIKVLTPLLPKPIANLYQNGTENDLTAISNAFTYSKWQTRLRMIPFKSIGAKNSIITGFRPDQIIIGNKSYTNIIIGICDFALDKQGEYSALMGVDDIE